MFGSESSSASSPSLSFSVGSEFIKAYYSTLSDHPADLYQLYEDDSRLVHCVSDEAGAKAVEVEGQLSIHDRVSGLGYAHCKVKVESLDVTESFNGGVLVMVT